ncbi:Nn.00g066980.m01.CDS01 [Neocucurbitaria sp. VM-36]
MLSGILIFNQKGENLIFRAFRNDCRPRLADVFRIQVISNAQVRSPILTLGSTTFSHVKHENIYLVAVTKSNANAALVFEFLYRLVGLGKAYFGKFDEEAVKNNFVLVYELLDEILDFGYPQNTETDTLKMYITTEGVKSERAMEDSSKITMQATGALSWRRADIKYRKNEAFVDVIEDVNLLMSATGTVLRADVNGQIIMRAYLSGTPECKFGLNDRLTLGEDHLQQPSGNKAGAKATRAAAGSVTLEDCQFHQCVKLGKFDADRIISFVPPDGEFELMRYRATENVNLPFKVHAIVNEVGKTKVEYSIAIRANYGSKLFATNVVVRIPTPLNTARITERTSQGKAKYEPEHNNIVWKIPRFTGQSEFVLSAEASLTSMTNQKAWSRPPLSLSFSLLMFTSSGLLVRYLKVFEKSNYSSVKWVRYMTRAGNYEIRIHKRSPWTIESRHQYVPVPDTAGDLDSACTFYREDGSWEASEAEQKVAVALLYAPELPFDEFVPMTGDREARAAIWWRDGTVVELTDVAVSDARALDDWVESRELELIVLRSVAEGMVLALTEAWAELVLDNVDSGLETEEETPLALASDEEALGLDVERETASDVEEGATRVALESEDDAEKLELSESVADDEIDSRELDKSIEELLEDAARLLVDATELLEDAEEEKQALSRTSCRNYYRRKTGTDEAWLEDTEDTWPDDVKELWLVAVEDTWLEEIDEIVLLDWDTDDGADEATLEDGDLAVLWVEEPAEEDLDEVNELTDDLVHFPKPAWQPVPQYAEVDPQYPYLQVNPPVAPRVVPQRALVETLAVEVGATVDELVAVDKVVTLRTGEDEGALVQVPARGLQPVPQ